MSDFVGYYRVSTLGQGRSGLGLEAQVAAVRRHIAGVGGTLAKEFREVESGANSQRPELQEALKYCRKKKAVLVIAKLDRLARNVSFISQLMESGVEFVAADMPQATKLTIHIIAAMAEHERDVISQRTKASLAAAKARGTKLGNPGVMNITQQGVAANQKGADDFAQRLKPRIAHLQASGFNTYSRLAAALDASGVKTQRGRTWTATGVRNIMIRLNMPLKA